ncbi:MAG: bifunctional folylpolyglutamate synthase/dihydrofolate synthase, partial [Candidatus Dormibacteraceae bacterium]
SPPNRRQISNSGATSTPSPHLLSYRERIQINDQPIGEEDFAAALTAAQPAMEKVTAQLGPSTQFELLTGLALAWLAPRADRLVIEVGLGGRLDSTNVLDFGLAVITNVDLDHQSILGSSVRQIAYEKAGIIKPGNLVITGARGEALEVIETRATELGCQLWRLGQEIHLSAQSRGWEGSEVDVEGPGFAYRGLRLRLVGSWQPENAALAVAAAHALGDATESSVREGLITANWPGRMQRLGSNLLLDGAHNPAALRRVVPEVKQLAGEQAITLLLGATANKELPPMLAELHRLNPSRVICTAASSARERVLSAEQLADQWGQGAIACPSAAAALEMAQAGIDDSGLIFVSGSLYLVGEVLGLVER